nr:MAG TPA: hypothetical protein [Caudoviricetes sp.]
MKFDGKKPVNPHIFAELKRLAIELWRTYDGTYGYASEKIGRIENLKNSHDNFLLIFSMFDPFNQAKIYEQASFGLRDSLRCRTGYLNRPDDE